MTAVVVEIPVDELVTISAPVVGLTVHTHVVVALVLLAVAVRLAT